MKKHKAQAFDPKVKPLFFKIALVCLAVLIVVLIFARIIFKTLATSNFFRVNQVVVSKEDRIDASYLRNKSILEIDLKKESRMLLQAYPGYSDIKLIRVLPNRIFIDAKRRVPVAVIKLSRKFFVDENRVLFEAADPAVQMSLPVITGLEGKILGPKSGARYSVNELILALAIVKTARPSLVFRKYRISRISARDSENISIFVVFSDQPPDAAQRTSLTQPELEVKIGDSEIKEKVVILANLLPQLKKDMGTIKYIDLRFKEPVIKYYDVKK